MPHGAVDRAASPGRSRLIVIALAGFVAVSALAGGLALLAGQAAGVSLAHTPFATTAVPALLLAIVIGGTNLVAAILAWRRSRFAIDAALLAGGALTVWILAEVAMLRAFSWLQPAYAALGVALLGVAGRAAWRSGVARHRWVVLVTAAEALGFLAPALTGILCASLGASAAVQIALLGAAGFVEGLVLGTGQALALPYPVRRGRYALLTASGVAFVWLSVMVAMHALPTLGPALGLPATLGLAITIELAIMFGVGALLVIGGAQWLELRRHVGAVAAARWIPWTALAWTIALPLSFLPSPFVDEATPIAVHIALWGSGGLLMAYVMALVTWQGVRCLMRHPRPASGS